MINALHLIWLIPLSAMFGFIVAAFANAAGRADARLNSVIIEEEQTNLSKTRMKNLR